MNMQIARGAMKELKSELKHTWVKLSDEDLIYLDGTLDQIIKKIQKANGYTIDQASDEFQKFKQKNPHYFRDERDLTSDNKENFMATASQLSNQSESSKFRTRASHLIEEDIIDPAKEYLSRAKDFGIQVVDRTSGVVKEHPGYAILGAATVGFLAGAYFFRRK
jgi:ElaB/YqjD/DUF883 family membrane-anchored ribosome-binding protein